MITKRQRELIQEGFEKLLTKEEQRILLMHNDHITCREISALLGLSQRRVVKSLTHSYLTVRRYAEKDGDVLCLVDPTRYHNPVILALIRRYAYYKILLNVGIENTISRFRSLQNAWARRACGGFRADAFSIRLSGSQDGNQDHH